MHISTTMMQTLSKLKSKTIPLEDVHWLHLVKITNIHLQCIWTLDQRLPPFPLLLPLTLPTAIHQIQHQHSSPIHLRVVHLRRTGRKKSAVRTRPTPSRWPLRQEPKKVNGWALVIGRDSLVDGCQGVGKAWDWNRGWSGRLSRWQSGQIYGVGDEMVGEHEFFWWRGLLPSVEVSVG